jgi:hypothetical protein
MVRDGDQRGRELKIRVPAVLERPKSNLALRLDSSDPRLRVRRRLQLCKCATGDTPVRRVHPERAHGGLRGRGTGPSFAISERSDARERLLGA